MRVVTRILDTTDAFREFARQGFLEAPALREDLFERVYAGAHPEVFAALRRRFGAGSLGALVRDLSRVRRRVEQAVPVMRRVIDELDPAVADLLDAGDAPPPLHVLLVGPLATNAFVDHLEDDDGAEGPAVFHCLEWYSGEGPARALVAHEGTHAWHRTITPGQPEEGADLLWTVLSEGLAIQASRRLVPDVEEETLFFYGVAGFEDWLSWCRQNRADLLERFRDGQNDPEAYEQWFGGGFVEGRWRVGFFLADELVGRLDASPAELARLSPEEGRRVVVDALAEA